MLSTGPLDQRVELPTRVDLCYIPHAMSHKQTREEFLKQPHIAVIATVDPRGQPHATPVWYLYQDGAFIIGIERGSRKHRYLEANPRVTVLVDRREPPYRFVMAQGRAEVVPSLSEELRFGLAVHYMGEEEGRRYFEETADIDFVTIRLRPLRFIEKDESQ